MSPAREEASVGTAVEHGHAEALGRADNDVCAELRGASTGHGDRQSSGQTILICHQQQNAQRAGNTVITIEGRDIRATTQSTRSRNHPVALTSPGDLSTVRASGSVATTKPHLAFLSLALKSDRSLTVPYVLGYCRACARICMGAELVCVHGHISVRV